MHKGWILRSSTNETDAGHFKGENPAFWSKQAMELLKSRLCLPEKGNAGEIMVALYMLFCGDRLRHAQDRSLRTFSVPLLDWYGVMRDPNGNIDRKTAALQNDDIQMDVNFIQVCRNYCRAHSWRTQKALKFMYDSGTATYVYPDCKAIDLVAAIRVDRAGTVSYHPLMVSVKCGMHMIKSTIDTAIGKMKDLLHDLRKRDQAELESEIQYEIAMHDKMIQDRKADGTKAEVEKAKTHIADAEAEVKAAQARVVEIQADNAREGQPKKKRRNEVPEGGAGEREVRRKNEASEALATLEEAREILEVKERDASTIWTMMENASEKQARHDLTWEMGVEELHEPAALCLLVLIGAHKDTHLHNTEVSLDAEHLGSFPEQDVFRIVELPDNDSFGISNSVREMTAAYAATEIYSSHAYIYGEESEHPNALLRTRPEQDTLELVKSLCAGLGSA